MRGEVVQIPGRDAEAATSGRTKIVPKGDVTHTKTKRKGGRAQARDIWVIGIGLHAPIQRHLGINDRPRAKRAADGAVHHPKRLAVRNFGGSSDLRWG